MSKTSKKKIENPELDSHFEKELAENGLAGFFRKICDRVDMTVETLTTGLPRLDKNLHSAKPGCPLSRRVEIYSKDPEVGKTSIALQIGVMWQKLGKLVTIVDIEDTITEEYLEELGYIMNPTLESGIHPVYLAKGYDPETGETMNGEKIVNYVGLVSRICDLVIVDSMAALAKRVDLERDPSDPAQPGGIGKLMYDHVRKFTHVRATALWINQALPQIGGYSPQGVRYKTSGGNAMPFFATIRLELRLVEKIKGKNDEIIGVKIDVYTAKNKISAPYKHVLLSYINGRGFCPIWDVFETAKQSKIIEKSGSWLSFGNVKLQGDLEFYKLMCEDPDFLETIKTAMAPKEVVENDQEEIVNEVPVENAV